MTTLASAVWGAAKWLSDDENREQLQQGMEGAKKGLELAGGAAKGVAHAVKHAHGLLGWRRTKGHETADTREPAATPASALVELCTMAQVVGRQARLQDQADILASPQHYMSPENVLLRGQVVLQGVLNHLPCDYQHEVIDAFIVGYLDDAEDPMQDADSTDRQQATS